MKTTHLVFYLYFVTQLASSVFQANECLVETKCGECIQSPGCGWCSKKNYRYSRCNLIDKLAGCEGEVSNPRSEKEFVQPAWNTDVGPDIQVQPQRVKLNLRPGEPANLRVTVRPALDFPVDLYYLMDMSWSMNDDLANLKALGGKLAKNMQTLTKNFRLGFGSFVDKTVSPYVRTELKKPCQHCIPSYGYRNILKLNENSTLFENQVSSQNISGSLDEPEGGFDALMQVAACENKIGWKAKQKSRRLVVFATDAPFHVAGDGKLGGIVIPNDMQCHLEKRGNYEEYTESNEQDYPTIAQLHQKLRENQIQPIFAVTGKVTSLYESISRMWTDLGAVTGKLATDSKNIVDLIQESYNKIVSTVKFFHDAPDDVSIEFSAQCGDNQAAETKECTNVKLGKKVYFDVRVTLQQCPKDLNTTLAPFQIRIPGFGSIDVELEHICECNCEKGSAPEKNSTFCSYGHGTYICGVCDCNEGRYGKMCECDSPFYQPNDLKKCKGDTDDVICSGKGQCICGKCECFKDPRGLIFGDKCQCDNFNCLQHNGKPCGGDSQGKCHCGKCQCKKLFIGDNCGMVNCSLLVDQCKKSSSEPICSGHGRCVCGECKCELKYTGKFCEECPGCPQSRL